MRRHRAGGCRPPIPRDNRDRGIVVAPLHGGAGRATTGPGSTCCSAPSASSCSSRAPTSPICCSRAGAAALAGDRDPRRHRRGPGPSPSPGADREPGARGGRRRCSACWLGYWGVALLAAFGPDDVPRLARRGWTGRCWPSPSASRCSAGWSSVSRRRSARASRLPARSAQGGRPDRLALGQPGPAPQRAGGRRDRARAGAAHRRRTADPERHRAQRRGSRFRPERRDRRTGLAARRSTTRRPEQVTHAFERIEERLAAIPGVAAAGLVSAAPLEDGSSNGLVPEGRPLDISSVDQLADAAGDAGLLRHHAHRAGARVGRSPPTDRRGAPLVMVINETLAREAFPGQDAVGKRIACCEPGPDGVARVEGSRRCRQGRARRRARCRRRCREFYLPMVQAPDAAWNWTDRTMTVAVRARSDAVGAA